MKRGRRTQALVEYILILALVAIGLIVAVQRYRMTLGASYARVTQELEAITAQMDGGDPHSPAGGGFDGPGGSGGSGDADGGSGDHQHRFVEGSGGSFCADCGRAG